MNDRQLIDDTHTDEKPRRSPFFADVEVEHLQSIPDETETPTPCPEILIELVRRVSALEEAVQKIKSNQP